MNRAYDDRPGTVASPCSGQLSEGSDWLRKLKAESSSMRGVTSVAGTPAGDVEKVDVMPGALLCSGSSVDLL